MSDRKLRELGTSLPSDTTDTTTSNTKAVDTTVESTTMATTAK